MMRPQSGQAEKRQQILEAAVRRFNHYGISKTTMVEIANDLNLSKALLYYYFPDKQSLFAACLRFVIQQSFDGIEPEIRTFEDCHEAMVYLLQKRIEFVSRHYNLLEYSFGAARQMPPEIAPLFDEPKQRQESLIGIVLEKGIRLGQLEPIDDIPETARMILLAIEGMRFSILKKTDEPLFPASEDFAEILRLQVKMVSLLLRGLAKIQTSGSAHL